MNQNNYAEGVRQLEPRVGAQRQPWVIKSKNKPKTLKAFHSGRTPSGFNQHYCELTQDCRYAPTLGSNWRTPSALTAWFKLSRYLVIAFCALLVATSLCVANS